MWSRKGHPTHQTSTYNITFMAFVSIDLGDGDASVPPTRNVARANALERENNVLPWRVDVLSDAALETLDALLEHVCRYPQRYSKDELAGAFLLQAALVTGRAISKLVELPIVRMAPSALQETSPPGLYIGRTQWAWWLLAGRPTSKQVLPPTAERLYRRSCSSMLLWCGERTKRLFMNAVMRRGLRLQRVDPPDGACRAYKLSPALGRQTWSTAAHRHLTTACLNKLPPSLRHAVSARRVESWLLHKLIQDTGEPAVGAILTDAVTSLSNAVVHYTWISAEEAVTRLHELSGRYDRVGIEKGEPSDLSFEPCPRQFASANRGHGSRYVLTLKAVRLLSQKLQHALRFGKHETLIDLIAFHNNFALYSFALLGFATGLRPGEDPIPLKRQIDALSGFLVWNDKGRVTQARDRLLWLPPAAVEQIDRYERHVAALRSRLSRLGIKGLEALDLSRDGRQSLFLLDPRQSLKRAGQKELAAAFEDLGMPIRLNTWRHYLRTELVGQLPGDILLAFLGHWHRGQDPWDSFSGLDPQAYRKALSASLPRLLERDGWVPVSGLDRVSFSISHLSPPFSKLVPCGW